MAKQIKISLTDVEVARGFSDKCLSLTVRERLIQAGVKEDKYKLGHVNAQYDPLYQTTWYYWIPPQAVGVQKEVTK